MELTGQPMVDVGLAIAALLSDKQSVSDLTQSDVEHAVNHLNEQLNPIKSKLGSLNQLKVLSAFWQNNPLAGHNMGVNGANVPRYREVLQGAAREQANSKSGSCQICGAQKIYVDANRSWFPLGASSEGDPCSLPSLSGKYLCAKCFSSIIVLPLGCKFAGGTPFFFHLSDPQLICEATRAAYQEVQRQIVVKASGNDALKEHTKLSGRLGLLEIVSGSRLWDTKQGGLLTKRASNGATIIAFSNAGTSPAWYQLHLPAQALDFFAELNKSNLRHIFLQWAQPCSGHLYKDRKSKERRPNALFEQLCDDVEQRQTIAPLLRAILVRRDASMRTFTKEEKTVLEIYEELALEKKRRFELLEHIASNINDLDTRYRDSFVKRLANLRRKEEFLDLLRQYAHSEKTSLRLTHDEIQLLADEKSNEIISLLYLLCVADN